MQHSTSLGWRPYIIHYADMLDVHTVISNLKNNKKNIRDYTKCFNERMIREWMIARYLPFLCL